MIKLNKYLKSVSSTWGAIASAIALIGSGFAVGCYYKDISHKIEINEINRKYQDELSNQKEEYDNLIIELRHTIQLLEIQNEKLKK